MNYKKVDRLGSIDNLDREHAIRLLKAELLRREDIMHVVISRAHGFRIGGRQNHQLVLYADAEDPKVA